MTTMTSVYQQFLADLSARVKAGTTTAEDIAWLTEATVKLGGSAAAEQEMLAAVNKALSTGEANLTAATTAAETATTAFNAQTTNLNLIPTLKRAVTDELQKVPVAVDATTRRHYTIQSSPPTVIFSSRRDQYFWSNGCANILQIDDFDTGDYYLAFDMGGYSDAPPQNNNYIDCKSHIIRISHDGSISQYAKKCLLNSGGESIAFTPTTDNTVRLVTFASKTLSVHNHMKIDNVAFSQLFDYGDFYVTSLRELLCVSNGKLVTIRHDGATVDNDTTFVDRDAFKKWAAQQGYQILKLNSVRSYNPDGFQYMMRDSSDDTHLLSYIGSHEFYNRDNVVSYGFSQQQGLCSLSPLKTGGITVRAAANMNLNQSSKAILFGASAELPISPFARRMTATIDIIPRNHRGVHYSYTPQILGFSIQHRALFYKFYERPATKSSYYNVGTIGIDFGV